MERAQLVEFVEKDYGRVVTALVLTCGDAARAEDAVQEALAAACERSDIRDLRGWVTKAALNHLRTRWRRLGAERRALERFVRTRPSESLPFDLGLGDTLLQRVIDALPRRQKEAVVLHYLLDMSVEQVAAVTGVRPGTVKTSLHRARSALRRALSTDVEEEIGHVG